MACERANVEHVGATLTSGVLEVHITKLERATSRKIEIEAEPVASRRPAHAGPGACDAGPAP